MYKGIGFMKETESVMQELINSIKNTKEYNQYHSLLQSVKSRPELYARIGEYHRRSLALQLYESSNFIQDNNNLQNEYADLQNNGLTNEFLAAEHHYCSMIRKLQEQFIEAVDIETGFLEE